MIAFGQPRRSSSFDPLPFEIFIDWLDGRIGLG